MLEDALGGTQVSPKDRDRIVQAINISPGLAAEVLGDRPMSDLMRNTLDCFFRAQQSAAGRSRPGHAETPKHEHKGAHAA